MAQKQRQEHIELIIQKALQDYNLPCNSNKVSTRLLSAKDAHSMFDCSATTPLRRLGKPPNGGILLALNLTK